LRSASLVSAFAACLGLAACGSTSTAGSDKAAGAAPSSCGTVAKKAPGGTADLSSLPAKLRGGYDDYFMPVNTSKYASFPAKSGPFTIGYSDSFSANSWRSDALARLKADMNAYNAKGLTTKLIATNSNLDNNLQIQQITSMINQGVDAIIAIPNSPTAFNTVIKEAYDKGIPFITLASHVTSPYAINVDGNYRLTGAMVAAGLGKMIGGNGDVLVVNGINGSPASSALEAGYKDGFAGCPGVKISGEVEGQWSEATAKTTTLQFLSTHPGQLAGVINAGGMSAGILQALQQTGHKAVPQGDANPDQGSLVALQKDLPDQYVASTIPPEQSMDAALHVAIATLQGQGPKFDTIVSPPPIVSGKAVLDAWVQPGWTTASANQAPAPPNTEFFAPSDMAAFFTKPQPLPALPE
jgi:ribose transport system substrate-binding protein